MTRPLRRSLIPDPAPRAGQTSRPNPFEGRGRGARAARRVSGRLAVQGAPGFTVDRREFVVWWADLMRRRCVTREACAVIFQQTFQTACNWFDGFSVANGRAVLQAAIMWPEEFADLAEGVAA